MMLIIQKDNKLKVATYGHYDGHPDSRGKDIFKNLKSIHLELFKSKLEKCSFYTEEEADIFRKEMIKPMSEVSIKIPDSVIQDSASVIEYIDESEDEKIMLTNDIDYIDSCDYVYFLNFDNNDYEIYKWISKGESNKCLKILNIEYKNFEQIAKFDINNLPALSEYKNAINYCF